ncbi:MAG: ABC transporter permease [Myxococcaceae bacterium]
MNGASLRALVRLSLARDRKGAFSSIFGVTIGVAALVFFVSLGLGVGRVIREKVFPVDTRLVEVAPPKVALGGLLGGKLDEAAVERLRALPGVEQAWRKMNLKVPAVSRYNGDFFGSRISMGLEVLAVGVDKGLIERDVHLGDFSDPGPDKPIPSIAAARLLEIYNKSFAPMRNLPALSPVMVEGFMFPVEINRSFVTASPPGKVIPGQMQLVGISDRGLLAGVMVPLDTIKRLNAELGQDVTAYTGVTLLASSSGEVPRLAAEIRKMGFGVDDQERRMAENAGAAVALTTTAMGLLSALICLLAAINIAHALSASVRARAKDLGVMKAVGASKRDIRAVVLAEAAVLGLTGGVSGTVIAVAAALGCDLAAAHLLPQFPFKPDTFFSLRPELLVAGVALGVLAAVVGAWLPSRTAASVDPAKTLAG